VVKLHILVMKKKLCDSYNWFFKSPKLLDFFDVFSIKITRFNNMFHVPRCCQNIIGF
jgi:hypothetical protein